MANITWLSNPQDSNYFNPNNWSTGTVPGSADTAIFDTSSITALTFSSLPYRTVASFQFNSGAPAYSFAIADTFEFVGSGITDNSSNAPSFSVSGGATLRFDNGNSSFDGTVTVNGGTLAIGSSSSNARIINNGGTVGFANLGESQAVGSIEGSGSFLLQGPSNPFPFVQDYIGSNNLSTTVSGNLLYGPLYKVGTGTLTLTGNANPLGNWAVFIVSGTFQLGNGGTAGLDQRQCREQCRGQRHVRN
jgi:autotransporter-associated beta strand protein